MHEQKNMAIRNESDACSLSPSTADILRRRAIELAKPTAQSQANIEDEWGDVLVVRVGRETLCLPTRFVNEVTILGQVLPLPGLPESYNGVASLRSSIYAVVDASRMFGLNRAVDGTGHDGAMHGVIVQGPDPESPETEFVLVVDAVDGVFGVKAADISAVPEGITKQLERYAFAMAKAAGEYGLVLDMAKLLSDEELRVEIAP